MKKLNWLFIIVFALLLVIAPTAAQDASDPAANKEVMQEFFVMEANRQWNRIFSNLTNDFVRHSVATEAVMPEFQVTSPSQYVEFLQATAAMFPDYYNDPQMVIAEGDYVTFYSMFHGTFVENGNPLVIPIMGLVRFAEGKMAEMWVEWDNLTWNNQMMAAPVEFTEAPVSGIEDVVGLSRLYGDGWAWWGERMADGTYRVGEKDCVVPGGCADWGEYAVEGGQIVFLTSHLVPNCEARYNVAKVTQGDRVGMRYAVVGDDCHEIRKQALDGKTSFFIEH
jgi:predicted ester cyclase